MTISIDIEPGKALVTGTVRHVIQDNDVQTFGLHDSALKNAVQAYFGKKPNDAYLRSPTPWGDLYQSYGWPQVETVLVAASSTIIEDRSKQVMLAHKNFVNTSNGDVTYKASMSQTKTNTSSHTWSDTQSFKFEQKFEYKISFGVTAGGESSMSYEYAFGQSGTESTETTLTSGTEVEVVVNPGQTKHAILEASQGYMRVRVVYRAYLTGDTAVNYNPTYNNHHFWGLSISRVMSSGNISNTKNITQDIVLDYYNKSTVTVGDGPAPESVISKIASA